MDPDPKTPGNGSRIIIRILTLHCGKKDRKFPSQVTDAADHNKPVTENSGIKFPKSLSDCLAIFIGIFSAIYFGITMC
jgi:hypothetical protein